MPDPEQLPGGGGSHVACSASSRPGKFAPGVDSPASLTAAPGLSVFHHRRPRLASSAQPPVRRQAEVCVRHAGSACPCGARASHIRDGAFPALARKWGREGCHSSPKLRSGIHRAHQVAVGEEVVRTQVNSEGSSIRGKHSGPALRSAPVRRAGILQAASLGWAGGSGSRIRDLRLNPDLATWKLCNL